MCRLKFLLLLMTMGFLLSCSGNTPVQETDNPFQKSAEMNGSWGPSEQVLETPSSQIEILPMQSPSTFPEATVTPESIFSAPVLTDPYDMEYSLLVERDCGVLYDGDGVIYDGVILGGRSIANEIEGIAIFDQINALFYVEQAVPTEFPISLLQDNGAAYDYLFGRRIVQISENADTFLLESLNSNQEYIFMKWKRNYEVFNNSNLVFSNQYDYYTTVTASSSLNGVFIKYPYYGQDNLYYDLTTENELHISDAIDTVSHNQIISPNGDFMITKQIYTPGNDFTELMVCSTKDGSLLYKIEIPCLPDESGYPKAITLYQITKSNKLLYNEGIHTYTIKLDGTNREYLGMYLDEPNLSPDDKYLAFRSPEWINYEEGFEDYGTGIYIKNLLTMKAVFYESQSEIIHFRSWIKTDELYELIR